MKPLASNEIRGNWVTTLLPINKDDSIDFDRLSFEIDHLISAKPNGLYCNGTAGEFYNLTEDEFDRVTELIARKCNASSTPFQLGVSHMSPVISIERLKRVTALRPSAVQLILPDWYPLTNDECADFLNRMAGAAGDISLVLYNPPHAKRVLSPHDLLFLLDSVPSLVGIKVGHYGNEWVDAMKPVAKRSSVFIPGHLIASGHRSGISHGAYSNMSCLNPIAAQRWTDQIIADLDGALEVEERIKRFMEGHLFPLVRKHGFANQAVDKLLVEIGGWAPVGLKLRWPYRSVPTEQADELRPVCKELLPDFFPA